MNMIFGAIIDENLKDEIKVTVIATGFEHRRNPAFRMPAVGQPEEKAAEAAKRSSFRKHRPKPFGTTLSSDQLDIPAFLRNRRNNDR